MVTDTTFQKDESAYARAVGIPPSRLFRTDLAKLRLKRIPAIVVVDRTGTVLASEEGVPSEVQHEAIVRTALVRNPLDPIHRCPQRPSRRTGSGIRSSSFPLFSSPPAAATAIAWTSRFFLTLFAGPPVLRMVALPALAAGAVVAALRASVRFPLPYALLRLCRHFRDVRRRWLLATSVRLLAAGVAEAWPRRGRGPASSLLGAWRGCISVSPWWLSPRDCCGHTADQRRESAEADSWRRSVPASMPSLVFRRDCDRPRSQSHCTCAGAPRSGGYCVLASTPSRSARRVFFWIVGEGSSVRTISLTRPNVNRKSVVAGRPMISFRLPSGA